MQSFLVIQTAFIGDAILASGVLEKLHLAYPEAKVSILVRKGNEKLFENHPYVHEVLVWNKKESKYKHLWKTLMHLRSQKYDCVITLQRFASSGFLTAFSAAKMRIGFNKNPFSFLFTHSIPHIIQNGVHEYQRNHSLIESLTDDKAHKPKLYPSQSDFKAVEKWFAHPNYICIAPASVWFTKQYPVNKWLEMIALVHHDTNIYLLGGTQDVALCNELLQKSQHQNMHNLAGKLSFLQTAALMSKAKMNFTNDSAPMHIASAVNAPTTAIYCSTLPEFGFGPLADVSHVAQTNQQLSCRPCGLHGKAACPEKHFKCAQTIDSNALFKASNV